MARTKKVERPLPVKKESGFMSLDAEDEDFFREAPDDADLAYYEDLYRDYVLQDE